MPYVVGFVIAVPTARKEDYRAHAEVAAQVLKELGALQTVECWGDDVPEGQVTSFPMAVKRRDDETVVFSWITWPSRTARDAGMARFMDHPRVKAMQDMPFDGQRMIYGGFEVMLDVS